MKVAFLLCFLFFKVAANDFLYHFRLNNKLFTYRLYWEHSSRLTGNFVFSPVSTQCALALAVVGADGDTAKEIYKTAYLPNGIYIVSVLYVLIQHYLSSSPTISIYNEIFAGRTTLSYRYKNLIQVSFNTIISDIPRTDHTFTLSSNELLFTQGARITSQLSLNVSWVHNFQPYPSLIKFKHLDGTESLMEMIYTKTTALLSVDTTWNVNFIEFPFTDDNLSFTLVFTYKLEDFPKFERVFPRVLYEPIKQKVYLEIVLPKFWPSYASDLNSILNPLGIELAFSEKADFSRIANMSQSITLGLHGTAFNISEVPVAEDSKSNHGLPFADFFINRPFIYILRHKVLGIMMIGRYV